MTVEPSMKSIFRKSALATLSTPDERDELMQVTSPRSWLALAAIGLVISAAVTWSLLGTVPVKIAGQGIFLRSEGVGKVVAPAAGQVAMCELKVENKVSRGDIIARIAQPELALELSQAQADLAKARADLEEMEGESYRRDLQLKLEANERNRQALRQSTPSLQTYLKGIAEKVTSQEQLLREGLITSYTLLQTRRILDDTRNQIMQNGVELARLSADDAALGKAYDEKCKAARKQLMEAEKKLEQAGSKMELSHKVECPFTGRVTEVLTREGDRVLQGAPLVNLELTESDAPKLDVLIFLPARDSDKVSPGMVAQISPTFVRKEEYGFMLAQVTEVGSLPVTRERMSKLLNNDSLVENLQGKDVTIEAHAVLEPDPGTVSGYKWSSSAGFPEPVQSGVLFQAQIVVKERKPITLIVPFLKKLTGW